MEETYSDKVGVIVGRFQFPSIDLNQNSIFKEVLKKKYNTNIVIIGVPAPAIRATKFNPLDFDSRATMINAAFPGMFKILYIKDQPNDIYWSEQLDSMIETVSGRRSADIYGTNYLQSHYVGSHEIIVFENDQVFSQIKAAKEMAAKRVLSEEAWRAGCFWATCNRWDSALPTVDCLILDNANGTEAWMAKKPMEQNFRFVGGFVNPHEDNSYEETAIREAKEETGLTCEILKYIGSIKVDDWRYRQESDKIFTSLFAMVRKDGMPKAQDDISELKRVNIMSLTDDDVVPEHVPLLHKVKEWIKNKLS